MLLNQIVGICLLAIACKSEDIDIGGVVKIPNPVDTAVKIVDSATRAVVKPKCPVTKEKPECCGFLPVAKGVKCCRGKPQTDPKTMDSCCEHPFVHSLGNWYDSSQKQCCSGIVQPRFDIHGEPYQGCCGIASLPVNKTCCNDVPVATYDFRGRKMDGCCGRAPWYEDAFYCCDGVPVLKGLTNVGCCGRIGLLKSFKCCVVQTRDLIIPPTQVPKNVKCPPGKIEM